MERRRGMGFLRMRIIAGPRKSSRTTRLIEMAAEFRVQGKVCYIVCDSVERCSIIAQKARESYLEIDFPISFTEFTRKSYYGKNIDCFLIDNADHLLQILAGSINIAAIVVEEELTI